MKTFTLIALATSAAAVHLQQESQYQHTFEDRNFSQKFIDFAREAGHGKNDWEITVEDFARHFHEVNDLQTDFDQQKEDNPWIDWDKTMQGNEPWWFDSTAVGACEYLIDMPYNLKLEDVNELIQPFSAFVDEQRMMDSIDQRKANQHQVGEVLEKVFMVPKKDRPRPASNYKNVIYKFDLGEELPYTEEFQQLCEKMDVDKDGWLSWKDQYLYLKSLPQTPEGNHWLKHIEDYFAKDEEMGEDWYNSLEYHYFPLYNLFQFNIGDTRPVTQDRIDNACHAWGLDECPEGMTAENKNSFEFDNFIEFNKAIHDAMFQIIFGIDYAKYQELMGYDWY